MELHEYPRPANDTGIGIHWTVGFASAIGMGKIRDFWIPEMKAMGIKWVKIFNHDGGLDFAELLLSEGFMPIVRIFRPSPNPSLLDIRELVHLDAYVRAGVRYFEFNNEPDLDSEWKGGRVPANGFDLVVENTIANLETILERGGMPAIPAVSNGSRWDLVGGIVARGRRDIFNGPVWQAVHNYARNRPLDYPYDIGNQEGASYTQRFYETLAAEQWGEDAWRGRSLADVNRLRLERSNPGATVMDDNACWLYYEYCDVRNRKHLGRSIPVLATEGGYLVGEDVDPRYPATTPDLHMAQTLEACRMMMGTSSRFQSAPDYFFCSAFWLIGNALLGSASTWCEHHSWYSRQWPEGVLPIVRALKSEPKSVRLWQSNAPIGARATLHGMVLHAGDRRTLILEKGGAEVARTTLDANSRYVMPDLIPGHYTLRVEGTAVEQAVDLLPGQEGLVVNLDLADPAYQSGGSTISGSVRGGANAVVMLLRTSDGEEWVTMARDDGSFRFIDLPAGTYTVRVQGGGSRVQGIMLDGKNDHTLELAAAGWGYTVENVEADDTIGAIRCSVDGHAGLQVQVHTGGWSSEPVLTGESAEFGEYTCVIQPVESGHYAVVVDGLTDPHDTPIKLEAYVNVERRTTPVVSFVYTDMDESLPAGQDSTIRGRVVGGCEPGQKLYVWLTDEQANRREQLVGDDCTFAFVGLGPGQYAVEVAGHTDVASQSDIALDGTNSVTVELLVPLGSFSLPEATAVAGESVIEGTVPNAAGRLARLVNSAGYEQKVALDPQSRFRFERLSAGVYTLLVEGGYQRSGLEVDGEDGLRVTFMPLVPTWDVKVSPAGSMPGYSVVRVEVEGMRGLPVYIWKEDWDGMLRRTGSKSEYGETSAEFSPLEPGHYMIEPEGLGVWADVELTGLEVVWIDFRRGFVPETPHRVESLSASGEVADEMDDVPEAPLFGEVVLDEDELDGDVFDNEPFEDELFDDAPFADDEFVEEEFDQEDIQFERKSSEFSFEDILPKVTGDAFAEDAEEADDEDGEEIGKDYEEEGAAAVAEEDGAELADVDGAIDVGEQAEEDIEAQEMVDDGEDALQAGLGEDASSADADMGDVEVDSGELDDVAVAQGLPTEDEVDEDEVEAGAVDAVEFEASDEAGEDDGVDDGDEDSAESARIDGILNDIFSVAESDKESRIQGDIETDFALPNLELNHHAQDKSGKDSLYLWLLSPLTETQDMVALLQYVAVKQPQMGDDLAVASLADHVMLVGDGDPTETERIIAALEAADVSYEVIVEDISKEFAAKLHSDV